MDDLVTCPDCKGDGVIMLPEQKTAPPNTLLDKIRYNISGFGQLAGDDDTNRRKPYKTCPKCRGFGMVRKEDTV